MEKEKDEARELYNRISALERVVAKLAADVENLASVVNRNNQPVNYIAVGSLVVALLAVGGTYINTRLKPIEGTQSLLTDRVVTNIETLGVLKERSRLSEEMVARVLTQATETRADINRLTGEVQQVEKMVDDIDKYGSRRWIELNDTK